jgi:CheY-like chemotaxis protein
MDSSAWRRLALSRQPTYCRAISHEIRTCIQALPSPAAPRTAEVHFPLRDTGAMAWMDTPPGRKRLRVLHLEDSELDHELAIAHLRRAGLEVETTRVDCESAFQAALEERWDIVLSDFNVPGFSGLAALEIVKASPRPLPFILISGEIGEDVAVAAMRNGASDYLLKANLARLAPAVEHAIDANEGRLAREHADRALTQSRQRLSELA